MPVLQYRGFSHGAASTWVFQINHAWFIWTHYSICADRFASPTFLNLHGQGKTDWTPILLIILVFTTITLVLSPQSTQPQATYVAYGLAFLFLTILIFKILCYLFRKTATLNPLILGQASDPIDSSYHNPFERRATNGSMFSLGLSECSVPPKYEYPPSYSQCVSSATINRIVWLTKY